MDHGMKSGEFLRASDIIASSRAVEPVISGIYFLIRDGRIIYVGQSRNLASRLATHAQSRVFDRWHAIPCEVERLNEVESAYIRLFLPDDNRDAFSRKMRRIPRKKRVKVEPAALIAPIRKPERTPRIPSPNVRSRELIEALDIDRPARQFEWMRRLRAVKADKSLRIDSDFGPDPFSLEWTPPAATYPTGP